VLAGGSDDLKPDLHAVIRRRIEQHPSSAKLFVVEAQFTVQRVPVADREESGTRKSYCWRVMVPAHAQVRALMVHL
jgi:hypothetical protein